LPLAGFLLGLIFHPEDGGNTFAENVSELVQDYTALHTRRYSCENLRPIIFIIDDYARMQETYGSNLETMGL
jgi:hypothetical protein